ncbi:MAG: aminoglycoside phosphotransferase family protein [Myxococcota bacterium]
MREQVDRVLARLGDPASVEIQPHSRSRRFENLRVRLGDDTVRLLRIARSPAGARGLQHEAAAFEVLKSTDLPVVNRYDLVDPEVFGAPASLSEWLPGLAGQGVLDSTPAVLPDVCEGLGQLQRALEVDTAGRFAMGVLDGRFQAVRATWRDEYLTTAWGWYRAAERAGASLGPLGRAVIERIVELSPALDAADRFCLVHGDLRPVNLTFELGPPPAKDAPPEVGVMGMFDWEFATLADPLLGFALPLELPDDALAHIVVGYGAADVRNLLDDARAVDRLTIYALGRALQYLGLVVAAQLEDHGMAGAHGLTYGARTCAERIQPGFVREKLLRAMPEQLPAEITVPDLEDPVRAVSRRALRRLAGLPVVGPRQVGGWMAAAAAALRDREHEDEGWVRDGEMALDELGASEEPGGGEPIADRHAWRVALDARVRASTSDLARGLWWLALESLAMVSATSDPDGWSVDDAVLRGLQSSVELLVQQPVRAVPDREALLGALLSLTCEARVPELLGVPASPDRSAGHKARMMELWEDLTVFAGRNPGSMDERDFDSRTPGLAGWVVPVVLLATSQSTGSPVSRPQIIAALCGPSDE